MAPNCFLETDDFEGSAVLGNNILGKRCDNVLLNSEFISISKKEE